jgi:hypothetical protein
VLNPFGKRRSSVIHGGRLIGNYLLHYACLFNRAGLKYTVLTMKLMSHFFRLHALIAICLISLLLSACNLQQQGDPTPTLDVTSQPQQETLQPTQSESLPTLRPTPTSLPLASLVAVTPQPGIPTAIPLGAGTAGTPSNALTPTLNAAEADQRYEMTVRDNKTIGVNYVVTLITGTVSMTLQGPDGVVWQKTLTVSETSRAEVPIKQGGIYEILVQIENFDGNYSVSWD